MNVRNHVVGSGRNSRLGIILFLFALMLSAGLCQAQYNTNQPVLVCLQGYYIPAFQNVPHNITIGNQVEDTSVNDEQVCFTLQLNTIYTMQLNNTYLYQDTFSVPNCCVLSQVVNGVTNNVNYFNTFGHGAAGANATFTIIIRPELEVKADGLDRGGGQDGVYKCPADGKKIITPYLVNPSLAAPPIVWSIVSVDPTNYGCNIDPNLGTVSVGTDTGTIAITATDANGCQGQMKVELGCPSCMEASCPVTCGNNSVDVRINLGWSSEGGSAGQLTIQRDNPSASLATPSALEYGYVRPDVQVITNVNGLRQILAPTCLANVVTNAANNYTVELYTSAQVLPLTNGLYPTSGSPFRTVNVQNPGGDTNQVTVTDTMNGNAVVYNYAWVGDGWQLNSGGGLRIETVTKDWSQTNTLLTTTRIIRDGASNIIYQTRELRRVFPWRLAVIEEDTGTGSDAKTNTYSYTANGYLQQSVNYNGSWQYYLYDSQNRPTSIFSSFLNQAVTTNGSLCRLEVNDYSTNQISGAGDIGTLNPNSPRCTIEYLLGQEIARTYHVYLPSQTLDIRCVTPGAVWNDVNNLVTTTTYFNTIVSENEVQSVLHPDGTVTIYQYFGPPSQMTDVVLEGHPNGSGTDIDDGTRTYNSYDALGHLVNQTAIDAASGITTSSTSYAYDYLNRLTNSIYIDGTSTSATYDCCNLTSTVDRDGTGTFYTYDALKRRITTTRAGVTVSNVLDAAGDTLATVRIGSDLTMITNQIASYDNSGFMFSSTDALGHTTSYTNFIDGSGQTITQTTFPDLSTRVETNAMDGSLLKIGGTAVHGVRYDYGVEADGGTQRAFTKTIPLNVNGSDSSEWTKSYLDMAERTYKILFADGASQNAYFNQLGQKTKTVDPDGVTMLYQYNDKGEGEYSVVDMDGDGTIDFAGTDLITQTTNDVVADQGTFVRRTRTFEWGTNGVDSAVLTSTSEQEIGGFRSWNISFGITNLTQTTFPGNGLQVTTSTLPDGSHAITTNQFGLLMSSTSLDNLGTQIGQTSYGYDPYNRQATVTDARTGATTLTYTKLDQLATITTPVPGVGQPAQVTTNLYDNMGRNYQINLPDGTSVANLFYSTGELKQTSGSRTYPVQYAYDYLGRVKTMTTWQNFSASTGPATTTWNYDSLRGFLNSKQYNDGQGPVYTNSAAGRLHSRTWARGITTTYGYDAAGRMTNISYNDGTMGVGYAYDRRGRAVQVTDTGVCTRTYNDAGMVLTDGYVNSGLSLSSTLNYVYDGLLRPTGFTNLSLGSVAMYSYDNASRLASVSDGANTAAYTYLPNSSLVSQVTFQQGASTRLTTTRSYDNLNRLTNVLNSAAANLSSFYGYNQANQRTSQLREDGSHWVYQYDSLGQVTSGAKYWSDGTPVAGQQFGYTFDTIGNRTQTQTGGDSTGSNLRTATYGANLLNQYTNRTVPGYVDMQGAANSNATVTVNGNSAYQKGEYYRAELGITNTSAPVYLTVTNVAALGTNTVLWARHALVAATPEGYGYDADGNLTNDGKWNYTWDGENLLTVVQSISAIPAAAKQRFEYSYDYQGRRIYQRQLLWDSGSSAYRVVTEERYWYDGWNLIGRSDLATGNVQAFICGLDLSGSLQGAGGVGGLLMLDDAANGDFFYSYDGNGNVLGLMNANDGTITAQYEYGPFGEVTKATGPMAFNNPVRFSTKFEDEGTGLSYYGYRYYNPNTGRWLSRDPIQEEGGLNVTAFLQNTPVNVIDKLGQSIIGKVIVFVAKGTVKGFKTIKTIETVDEAVKAVKDGEDIVVKSEQAARQIALTAGDGATPIKEFDKASQSWHYHPGNRCGGHILYSAVGLLTFSHYAKGQGTAVETAAQVGDLVNPLSVGQDLMDIYQLVESLYVPEVPIEPTHPYKGPNGEFYVGRNPPPGYRPVH